MRVPGIRFSEPVRSRCRPGPEARELTAQLVLGDHPVDQPVLERLLGGEEAVALHVVAHALLRLPGVPGVDLVDLLAQRQRLAGVDLDVACLALEAARRLVDQDPAVGQRQALALVPAASSSEPMLIATPKQIVCTSGLMNRIVS